MKSVFIALFVVLFVSCDPNDLDVKEDFKEENEQEILAYINANGLDATRTESGLYYIIDEVGEGAEITLTSDVTVKYKGYYTDGVVLDENTDDGISFNLQQMIPGWREGLQLFHEGGSGTLIIPSHLAYGNVNYNGIPAGSVLVFDIEVVDYEALNRQEITDYIQANELDATETESGLFYVIDEEGTGSQPTETSNVTVVYKGYFTNGEVFDESSVAGTPFNLSQVIPGWTEGIQYFKEGGSGMLLVPSSLGYGRYGNQVIPGGAVLIFEINVKEVF